MNIMNLLDDSNLNPYDYGKRYKGMDKEIASNFAAKDIGFHLEILAPGCFSAPYHFHEKEEELVIVLQGEAMLRENNKFRKVKEGDLIFFPTGKETPHQLYNHSSGDFRYFVLSSKSPEDICVYPDSRKILDRKLKVVTQDGNPVDYWKDEEDPAIHWPASALAGKDT